jgi:PAS domain S-box-containing protein
MPDRNKRLMILAVLMVLTAATVSYTTSNLLYKTALNEQKRDLYDLVQSQAILAGTILNHYSDMEKHQNITNDMNDAIKMIGKSQAKLESKRKNREFVFGVNVSGKLKYLVIDGKKVSVPSGSDGKDSGFGFLEKMYKADKKDPAIVVGTDSQGKEIMTAYAPVSVGKISLGMVIKKDIYEVKKPFMRTNAVVFTVSLGIIMLGLFIFHRFSSPLLKSVEQIEKEHQGLIKKLEESRKWYKSIFENAPVGILCLNRRGEVNDCNKNMVLILGTTHEKLIGFNKNDIIDADMREAIEQAISGERAVYEGEYTSVTGQKKTFIRAIYNPTLHDEPPYSVVATFEDISLSKKIEKELAESERRFKSIAKAAPVGIIITDFAGNSQYANSRAVQLCDSTFEKMRGDSWTHSLEEDDKSLVFQHWFQADHITTDSLEFQIHWKDRGTRWVLGQIVKVEEIEGEKPEYVITMTDITPIKDAELEYKKASAIMDQTAEAIMITDTSGIITYVNPAFEKISGYPSREIIGKKPGIISSEEHDNSVYVKLWSTIESGEVWKGRLVNLDSDGKRYTQETTITPIRDESGNIVSYVSIARDITQQLVIEAQLRQAQKLESIGELAAGIAHEINTPTQYVTTNVKFLEDGFIELVKNLKKITPWRKMTAQGATAKQLEELDSELINEEELEYLEEDIPNAIKESLEGLHRIAEIVRSVKQLSHPGEKQKSYHDLNVIIKDAVTVSTNEWKYVADVDTDFDENMPQLHCLKGELGQVFLNLIVNSAHAIQQKLDGATEEKGLISIKTSQNDDSAIISVTDTGSGMSPEIIKKAFDPFFTTKEIGKGTGQGLAIAYNVIVNIHKGSIVIDSEEGAGTTITMTLPINTDV